MEANLLHDSNQFVYIPLIHGYNNESVWVTLSDKYSFYLNNFMLPEELKNEIATINEKFKSLTNKYQFFINEDISRNKIKTYVSFIIFLLLLIFGIILLVVGNNFLNSRCKENVPSYKEWSNLSCRLINASIIIGSVFIIACCCTCAYATCLFRTRIIPNYNKKFITQYMFIINEECSRMNTTYLNRGIHFLYTEMETGSFFGSNYVVKDQEKGIVLDKVKTYSKFIQIHIVGDALFNPPHNSISSFNSYL